MMEIGNVVAKGGGRFEWIIPHFSTLPRNAFASFCSPDFDAEDEEWCLWIQLSGTSGNTRISFTLRRSSSNWKPLSCTVGVKRADHSEEMIGTETCGGYSDPDFIFNKTRREVENGGWLLDDQLTVTLLFGGAHAPRGDTTSRPRYIRTEQSESEIDQDSRRDASKPPKAKAKRKLTSRETKTDALDTKIRKVERLEDCTCIGAKGARQLIENLKGLLTKENKDYDVRILVKGREFRAHSLILKARSPVLGMMLTHDSKEKTSGTIHIEDCDPDCFDEFLLFVYSGSAENLTTSKALSLYYVADKYDLPLLKEQCVDFLEASLSVTSVCDVVLLATKHGEEELLRTAAEYFVQNIKTILSMSEWQNFMVQNPTVANELYMKGLLSKDA